MGRINLRSSHLFLRVLPVLVWSGAVLCVIGLYHRRAARFEVVGLAQPEVRQVAATCDARLISVPFQLFDKVKEGDTVAMLSVELDDEAIDAEIETIAADMNQIVAQLTETRNNYVALVFNQESEWWAEMRAFTADIVSTQRYLRDANESLEDNQATLYKMNKDIEIFTMEHGADLGTDISLYNRLKVMRTNREKQLEQIERDKEKVAKYQKEYEEAYDRREKYKSYRPIAGTTDEEFKRAIDLLKDAFEKKKEVLLAKREKLVLTAPCDGYISDITSEVGEAVMQGVEILSIAKEKPRAIIAYANEGIVGQLSIGKRVEVVKGSMPPQKGPSTVTYIGPAVEQLPQRLWRNPNFPQWGRPLLIEIPSDMQLIPGEIVGIKGLW
jgi:multidrug resistance efflux pump